MDSVDCLGKAVMGMTARVPQIAWAYPAMACAKRQSTAPRRRPVCDLVPRVTTFVKGRDVLAALGRALADLDWQQTYTSADGFSQAWLDAYGWVNLFAPDGVFQTPDLRLSLGYWGAGADYPMHVHAAREDYLILSGSATFIRTGQPDANAKPGDVIHVEPWVPHGTYGNDTGLLVAAYWRGEGLDEKSTLVELGEAQ